LKYIRLFNEPLAPLLHHQFLRETLGLKDILSLRGKRQVTDTFKLKAFQRLEPITVVSGSKEDAGTRIAEALWQKFRTEGQALSLLLVLGLGMAESDGSRVVAGMRTVLQEGRARKDIQRTAE